MVSFNPLSRKITMHSLHLKKLVVIGCILITLSACQPEPEPDSTLAQEATEFNYTVNRTGATNENSRILSGVGNEFDITTNNCGSSVNAQESLSRSREFTINVNTEISKEISGMLEGKVLVAEGEIAAAVAASFGVELGTTESVNVERKIETPADTISVVTLQWEEMWDIGTVSIYRKDGTVIGKVPYRILTTLNLTQLGIKEFPCGTSLPDSTITSEPALTNTSVAAATNTPEPTTTDTPQPTLTDTPEPTSTDTPEPPPTNTPIPPPTNTPIPVPTNTPPPPTAVPAPQNTGLSMGQWYTTGNISIGVTEMKFRTSPGIKIGLTVPVRNVSNGPISFQYGSYNFLLKDNNGNTYPAEGSNTNTVSLNAGETERFLTPGLCCQMFFKVNHADPSITELTFSVSNLSSVEYAEWKIPVNH